MFFDTSHNVNRLGQELLSETRQHLGKLDVAESDFALTVLLHPLPLTAKATHTPPLGFAHNGRQAFYPASVVKCFYLAAFEAAFDEGRITKHGELERALHDMIYWSSNTATNYVIDLISETTGDTLLEGQALREWQERRQIVNRYFAALGWPELDGINVCQKLMDDQRYGRERMFATLGGNNHNRLTCEGTARLLYTIFSGQLGNPQRCERMRQRLHRPLTTSSDLELQQIKGYFGAGLPANATLYSKAGWNGWTGDPLSSYNRHDAAYIELPPNAAGAIRALTLVLFSHGKRIATDEVSFPLIAKCACALATQLQLD